MLNESVLANVPKQTASRIYMMQCWNLTQGNNAGEESVVSRYRDAEMRKDDEQNTENASNAR